ncbi:heat-inducible transcription repressor [Thalictrum thalictroides]|uniref:Heat-inducible transcription repressor n=1 Tax=Thalictrum thalictroides TaxID=46969 RepID=A0A7J6W8N5_THATH|nr:heat-inducible transcription repressor [Thalictrum thalictroides]
MNFLMRSTQPAVPDQPTIHDLFTESRSNSKAPTTLEGLIAEDPFPQPQDGAKDNGVRVLSCGIEGSSAKNRVGNHSDVTEHEGWITIPYKELPENWCEARDILSFRSLDRSFVFPGEQVHILACLSASKKDTEIITPFKVAAVMSKNGILKHNTKQHNEVRENDSNSVSDGGEGNSAHLSAAKTEQNGETLSMKESIDTKVDVSASESLVRMEDHKKQTESQLERFKNSHFFVRIAESDEPLWSKRSIQESSSETSTKTEANAYIDRGSFDANVSGGVARDAVKCCSLSNGDIVMLLQVNVGTYCLKDPILEVLQFEKYQDRNLGLKNSDNFLYTNQKDPCGELLKWLLPLDRALPPPVRPLSPPSLSSNSAIGSATQKSNFSASSGSPLFSFGNFRSYSMSSLPPNSTPPSLTTSPSKPNLDPDDWDRFSPLKASNSEAGNAGLLSFRGVPLEPDRFSVHCGLEGIYIPGRRWRKKLEIIQPVEIHSFAAECNTEDLLCVQIKNVSPPHIPDIVIYLDAIAIVFEDAPRGGPPISLPITCVEAGNDYSLPNLTLRRNEEHSFILKPATSMWRNNKVQSERGLQQSQSNSRGAIPNLYLPSKTAEGKIVSSSDHYAVLVSCRCNYTESRLFFKQRTSWRPHFTRDIMISVASEMSEQSLGPSAGLTQLPVQVLTLQASNLTSEDLTLTVLAPASLTSPPSVVSLNSAPSTPMSPFVGFSELAGRGGGEKRNGGVQRLSSMPHVSENQKEKASGARSLSFDEQTVSISDVVPTTGLGCTHLWLQSAVPLGRVPSQSTATVKLELLPLTDGIITLDTLQVNVKEKGLTFIPEHSLKIYATSSIATGIV